MSFSNAAETSIMALIFCATAWANYADNAASSPQTNIAYGLHTADPGDTGNMSTSEASYTSYARVNVARSTGGHTETNGSVSPNASVDFPAATGGSNTITHMSTGKTGGGSAAIILSGTVTPNLSVSNPIQPKLSTATALSLD